MLDILPLLTELTEIAILLVSTLILHFEMQGKLLYHRQLNFEQLQLTEKF